MENKPNKLNILISAVFPPIAWAAIIFFLSSQPVLPGIEVYSFDFILKKTGHMFVYAVLYILLYRSAVILSNPGAFKALTKRRDLFVLLTPILICLIYAISDEIHQSFTPNRFPSARDVGYDMLGVWIAYLKVYKYI